MKRIFSIVFFAFFLFAGIQMFASDVDVGQTDQQEQIIETDFSADNFGINLFDRATGHADYIFVFAVQPETNLLCFSCETDYRFYFNTPYIHDHGFLHRELQIDKISIANPNFLLA